MNSRKPLDDDVFAAGRDDTHRRPSTREYVGPSNGTGQLTSPSSGSQHEKDAPQMLMSPPPEELLRVRVNHVFVVKEGLWEPICVIEYPCPVERFSDIHLSNEEKDACKKKHAFSGSKAQASVQPGD
jgi:hypothetical protein